MFWPKCQWYGALCWHGWTDWCKYHAWHIITLALREILSDTLMMCKPIEKLILSFFVWLMSWWFPFPSSFIVHGKLYALETHCPNSSRYIRFVIFHFNNTLHLIFQLNAVIYEECDRIMYWSPCVWNLVLSLSILSFSSLADNLSIACYPYQDSDPFVLEKTPHVYVVGNQRQFQTKLVKGTLDEQCPQIIPTDWAWFLSWKKIYWMTHLTQIISFIFWCLSSLSLWCWLQYFVMQVQTTNNVV